MKKMIKKIAAAFMAMALVAVGMLAANKAEVKAAEGWDDGTVYVCGNQAVHGAWNAANAATMTNNGDGTYTLTFNATAGTMYEFKFLQDKSWDGVSWGPVAGGNFGYLALNGGEVTVTLDTNGEGDSAVSVTGLVIPNPAETYYVRGEINSWSASANQMTDNGDGTYTATFTNVEASFNFKIAQDSPTYDWYKAWGAPAAGQGENNNDNITATVTAKSDVTIKFTPAQDNVEIIVTPVQDDDDDTTNPSSPAGDNDDDTTNPSSPAGDNDDDTTNPSSPAGDNDDDTTNPSSPAGDNDDDTTAPSQSSPAGDSDDDTTTPSQSSPAGDDDDDTTAPSQSSPAGDDDDDTTTPSQSSPAGDDDNDDNDEESSAGDTPAGDNSMVAIFAILAVLAAGVVTVAVAKRRAIEE